MQPHLERTTLHPRPFAPRVPPQHKVWSRSSRMQADKRSPAESCRGPGRFRQTPKTRQASVQTQAVDGQVLYDLADIDAKTAGTIAKFLGPLLTIGQLLMIVRIVLTWYPNINGGKLPWSIAVKPTEPVLAPTRKVIPIVGGLDVTPIVWVAFLSFSNEILLGPQGILNLLQRKVDL